MSATLVEDPLRGDVLGTPHDGNAAMRVQRGLPAAFDFGRVPQRFFEPPRRAGRRFHSNCACLVASGVVVCVGRGRTDGLVPRRIRVMNPASVERGRKERLLQMIDVAQAYRGCSKAQIASYLDRDPAKIAPDSGNPKLDLLFNLADIIDWPVGELAETLWGRHESRAAARSAQERPKGTFKEIDQLARDAHRRGAYAEMRNLGEQLLEMATTPVERACALTRIGGACHDEGRYGRALEQFQAALAQPDLAADIVQMLRVNLASTHLALWNLTEAEAIGRVILLDRGTQDPSNRRNEVSRAHAHFVIGTALLRSISSGASRSRERCEEASGELQTAHVQYSELATRYEDATYRGVANTCVGQLIEAGVELGELAPSDAAGRLLAGLDAVIDPSLARGDVLESWGWWCVSGLGIALRHLHGDERERLAAIFSNKAFELAEASGCWPLRERAFTLSFLTQQGGMGTSRSELPRLDKEDLRVLVGTMGRFPFFRPTGWQLLSATLAGQS